MDERSVGENIRRIRLKANVGLAEVAKRAGITKSTLSKVENGRISSPISTLLSIATALGVHLSNFFMEEGPAPRFVLTRKGKGETIVRDGTRFGYSYEAIAIGFPGRPVDPFLLTIPPGKRDGKFKHDGHEFIYVVSGDIEFTLGDKKLKLGPGDSLYFDPTVSHGLKLLGRKPARLLCLFIETKKS